ncbi:hypothetical protein C8J57DRAFT_1533259 [Mycena rebaudengoi]|nr:hypothetical protein C8J57DRAFT_1533259 [Mycena rebaudengoi]
MPPGRKPLDLAVKLERHHAAIQHYAEKNRISLQNSAKERMRRKRVEPLTDIQKAVQLASAKRYRENNRVNIRAADAIRREQASNKSNARAVQKARLKKPYIMAPGNPALPAFLAGHKREKAAASSRVPVPLSTPQPSRPCERWEPPMESEEDKEEASEEELESEARSSRKRGELSGCPRRGDMVELVQAWRPLAPILCVPEYLPHPRDNHSIAEHSASTDCYFYGVTRGQVLGVYTSLDDVQLNVSIVGGTYFIASDWVTTSRLWSDYCEENHSHERPVSDSSLPDSPSTSSCLSVATSRFTTSCPNSPDPVDAAPAYTAHPALPIRAATGPKQSTSSPCQPPAKPRPDAPPTSPSAHTLLFLKPTTERAWGSIPPMPPTMRAHLEYEGAPSHQASTPLQRPPPTATEERAAEDVVVYAIGGHPVMDAAFQVFQDVGDGVMLSTISARELAAFVMLHRGARVSSVASIAYAVSGQHLAFKNINSAFGALQKTVDGEMLFTVSASELRAFMEK